MELTDLLIIITVISLIVLLAFLIPALIQVKKTTRKTEILIDQLSVGLEPLLTNINGTSTELQELSETLREKIDKTDTILESAQEASFVLFNISSQLKEAVTPLIPQIGGIAAGINAFGNFFRVTQKQERRYFDE